MFLHTPFLEIPPAAAPHAARGKKVCKHNQHDAIIILNKYNYPPPPPLFNIDLTYMFSDKAFGIAACGLLACVPACLNYDSSDCPDGVWNANPINPKNQTNHSRGGTFSAQPNTKTHRDGTFSALPNTKTHKGGKYSAPTLFFNQLKNQYPTNNVPNNENENLTVHCGTPAALGLDAPKYTSTNLPCAGRSHRHHYARVDAERGRSGGGGCDRRRAGLCLCTLGHPAQERQECRSVQ
jgi:hypothetical protein